MNVSVAKGKSKTKTPGAYHYEPNAQGEGGTFVEDGAEHVDYWYLTVDGVELAGVWMDEASALRDADTLRHLFTTALQVRSGEKGGSDAT